MNIEVTKEVKKIIKKLNLNCSVKEFSDKVDWYNISSNQELSENFIKEFKDKVNWHYISDNQQLSENFIREFQNEVHWNDISFSQKLSENFIKEFEDKVHWENLSSFQQLSENFMREFKYKVNWYRLSHYQKLSENFIQEFQDKVYWNYISEYQQLSANFIREFQDKIDIKLYKEINRKITNKKKLEEVEEYCKKYNLELDLENKCFYAFRNHDNSGRGMYNKTISYKKGKYYKDWHLDMRQSEKNSFGLGIFPIGNTKVKVLIEDWGLECNREDGKCRVWGFEIV